MMLDTRLEASAALSATSIALFGGEGNTRRPISTKQRVMQVLPLHVQPENPEQCAGNTYVDMRPDALPTASITPDMQYLATVSPYLC